VEHAGVTSTLIDCTQPHPRILREGAYTKDYLQRLLRP
jgi:tRNA A37 threonylcarbamoyladenosine synthetase subunit TsaC/SUA5/YrdC